MMDQITKENIDQWLFNSMEGELTSQEIAALNEHLALHPADLSAQEEWNTSHFKAIEIEEFPNLKALQKGKGAWWKKGWVIFAALLLISLIALFSFYPFSANQNNVYEPISTPESSIVQENVVLPVDMDSNTDLTPGESPANSSPVYRPKKEKKTVQKIEDTPLKTDSIVLPKIKIEKPIIAELKKAIPFAPILAELLVLTQKKARNTPNKGFARRQKKAKRKEANKRYQQNVRRGHDPKIVPLENVGF
jgi:hypothetical protein